MTTPAPQSFAKGSASPDLVASKRQAHIGRVQEQVFLLEAALADSYAEIDRLLAIIRDYAAQEESA